MNRGQMWLLLRQGSSEGSVFDDVIVIRILLSREHQGYQQKHQCGGCCSANVFLQMSSFHPSISADFQVSDPRIKGHDPERSVCPPADVPGRHLSPPPLFSKQTHLLSNHLLQVFPKTFFLTEISTLGRWVN